jgi:hypothetical protein
VVEGAWGVCDVCGRHEAQQLDVKSLSGESPRSKWEELMDFKAIGLDILGWINVAKDRGRY